MKRKIVIAIDGPAGAGKSTIAKIVADKLGYCYVDTGAMYRAVAWKAKDLGISFKDHKALEKIAEETDLVIKARDGISRIHVEGVEVTHKIRTQEITRLTNILAAVQGVRKVLRQKQRDAGRNGGIVMEGRDIGTVVFPNADMKFYLDASPMERAERRYKELKARKMRVSLHSIAEAIRKRDYKDRTRGISPLKIAKDAVVVDTTHMSQSEVVDFILDKIENGKGNTEDA